MAECFSALPGTYVLQFDPEDVDNPFQFPVVGWTKGLIGFDPVTIIPEDGRMEYGKAILLQLSADEEWVVDPTLKRTFYSIEDWLGHVKGAKPVAKPNRETGNRRRVNLFIQFGTKTYVNKSFWHFKTVEDEFLFELEGGEEAPDDPRVQKINRDTFYRARKMLEVVPFADLFLSTKVEVDEAEGLL